MKKIISLLVILLGCFFSAFAQKDSLKTKTAPSSLYFTSLNEKRSFIGDELSEDLKTQLKKYNLIIYNTNKLNNGYACFSTDYLGKSFFKDYYTVYKYDLIKYLPKPPDFTLFNYRKKY